MIRAFPEKDVKKLLYMIKEAAFRKDGYEQDDPVPGYEEPAKPAGPPPSSTPIGKMQAAIKEFAKVAVDYKKIPTKGADGKVKYSVDRTDKRRDFNDFLAEQFMAGADVHGSEFSTSSKDTSKESKLPTDIIQLDVVINGLSRLGPGQDEGIIDGRWDFRTTNAIRNVCAFAASIIAANEELGNPGDSSAFTSADLAELKSAIPQQRDPFADKVPQKGLNEIANKITPLVNKLTDFYKKFSKNTLGHPAYARYIEQDSPVYTFKPGGSNPYKADPSDPAQKRFMENPETFILPMLRLTGKNNKEVNLDNKIKLQSLQTTSGIVELMTQYLGYNSAEVNNPRLLTQTVRSILDQVKKFIDTNGRLIRARSSQTPS